MHDWRQYEESPGNGRQGWYVWKRLSDAQAIEMYLVQGAPAEVEWVEYGPRGGTYKLAGGTLDRLQEQIRMRLDLIAEIERIEALRGTVA